MSRSARLFTMVVCCIMFAAFAPPGALGASTNKALTSVAASAAPAPLVVGTMDAQIWPGQEGQQTVVIVDVVLDPKVKLPARVRIPVPVGSVVEWAGEILGGNPDADPQRTFDLQTGAGGAKYAEFTLSVSHRGQIDTSGIAMTAQGQDVTTKVEFVQSARAASTTFAVRLPAGANNVRIVPAPTGQPETNSAGETLYPLPKQNLALGATTNVTVTYNPTPAAVPQRSSTNITTVYIVLGVLLVAAIAVTVYLLVRQANEAQISDGDDQTEADDDAADRAEDDAEYDSDDDVDDDAEYDSDDSEGGAESDVDEADDAWSD